MASCKSIKYADGAIHNDHHKSLTITMDVSTEELMKISKLFFADDDDEPSSAFEPTPDDALNEMLMASNNVINLKILFRGKDYEHRADWLYAFIKEHFVQRIQFGYEWYALYKFMSDRGYLRNPEITKFAEQMNLWFDDVCLPCRQSETGRYNFLSGFAVENWLHLKNENLAYKTSRNAVSRLFVVYNYLIKTHDALLK